jgi:uncharacterized protein (TIGR00297 family)
VAPNELLRKRIHIAVGLGAFSLKWLPWWAAALVAAAAVLSNWVVLPRLLPSIARGKRDVGILLYPLVVLVLIVVFRERLEYAAIAWVMLGFGDGFATLMAKSMRTAPLPWNPEKSWGGFVAFLVFGCAAGLAIGVWMDWWRPVTIAIVTLVAAIVESLPLRVDDNLTVPFASAIALVVLGFEPVHPYGTWPATPAWLIANGALAILGFYSRSVSFSGALGGFLLGAILILGAGWPLYVALLAFFVIGTAATKLGYSRKARAGLAQEGGGRRGFSHAFSNVGVAAICAIAMSRITRMQFIDVEWPFIALLMGVASLATAAADTTASEIGQLIGRRAFLPLTLRRVPVGTEGAISIEGTLAGLIAGFLVALSGAVAANRAYEVGLRADLVAALTVCAFLGSYLESIVGSWNRRYGSRVPNGVLNFFNTFMGAILFYWAVRLFQVVEWHRLL